MLYFGLLFIGSITVCIGQIPNRFLKFNIQQGLSQNSVTCIYEDSRGIMWFGTQEGLNKFDGRNFTTYKCNEHDSTTLSNNYILKIVEDSCGGLWIGTSYGLNRMDLASGKVNRFFLDPHHEKNATVASYDNFEVYDQNHLIVIYGKIRVLINTKTFQVSSVSDTFIPGRIRRYQENLFILDVHKNLHLFHGNNLKKIVSLPISKEDIVLQLALNQKFVVFNTVDSPSIVHVYDHEKENEVASLKFSGEIFSIHIDKNNRSLVGYTDGLFIWNPNGSRQWIHHDEKSNSSLSPGPVLTTYVDHQQNIWCGMSSAGVMMQPVHFDNFNYIPTQQMEDAVQSTYQKGMDLYVGASTGLYQVIENKLKLLRKFENKRVTAICLDYLNRIWVGVERGGIYILRKDGKILEHLHPGNSILKSDQILHLEQWGVYTGISAENGFYLYSPKGNMNYFHRKESEKMKFSYVMQSIREADGDILLSTNHGIISYDSLGNELWTLNSYSDTSFFGKTLVSSILPMNDHSYWVGTLSNGIFQIKENKILTQFSEGNGLGNNTVYSIVRKDSCGIYACTNGGIYFLKEGTSNFDFISPIDGIPTAYYTFGSLRNCNNHILIGNNHGVFRAPEHAPQLINKQTSAFLENVAVDDASIPINQGRIHFASYNKLIYFAFNHSLQLSKLIFQYKLDQGNWITLPMDNKEVAFSSFPYYQHELLVRCAISPELLHLAPIKQYKIYNTPPFWKTWWFNLIVLGIFLSASYYFIRWLQKRKLEKELNELKQQKLLHQEKLRISRDLHDHLGSYASALRFKVESLKEKEFIPADLEQIQKLCAGITSNIRETIWILQSQTISIQTFSDKVKNHLLRLHPLFPKMAFEVKEHIESDQDLQPNVAMNLFRIVQEAIQNACVHSKASQIIIMISSIQGLEIIVRDNGQGMSEKNAGEEHYGLRNMKQRSEEINFQLEIGSTSQGTCIKITELK